MDLPHGCFVFILWSNALPVGIDGMSAFSIPKNNDPNFKGEDQLFLFGFFIFKRVCCILKKIFIVFIFV